MNRHPEVTLAAGRLSALYQEGSLRHVVYSGVEILRQIYFAVRDRDWRTVAPRIVHENVTAGAEEFSVDLEVLHSEGPIEFRWKGRIRGSASCIEFSAAGEAGSRFRKNRIGLCVLHPATACAGARARITHTDGSIETTTFPRLVSPVQVFTDLRAITHEPRPGLEATVTFEGEVFESEDQRNWTDGSFKTYSTPLSQPFPVEVQPGWRVDHRVVCELRESVVVIPRPDQRFDWPLLGTGSSDGEADLRALGLNHVRVDIRNNDTHPLVKAARFGLPLEVALHSADVRELAAIRDAALALTPGVARWIVFGIEVGTARTILPGPVGAGTNANFAELNRNRESVEGADFAAFSVNPQVHGCDELTIVESLQGQADAVKTALSFAGRVAVSPVTLLPRFNAVATSGAEAGAEPPVDPRQATPFTAAWTLGSIASLVTAGASSITYFEAAGPRGIAGTPVAALLGDIAKFAPGYAFACDALEPPSVAALGLGNKDRRRIVVANLRDEPTQIMLTNADEATKITLEPYAIRWFKN